MPGTYYNYTPARLVQGRRWCITYYQENPKGERIRIREYHDLNRIKDEKQRMKKAMQIIYNLNENLLPYGYPYHHHDVFQEKITIIDAVDLALSIKETESDRQKSHRTYMSIAKFFKIFLQEKSISEKYLYQFTEREASAFMDYILQKKKITATTYNNYKRIMILIFNTLIDKKYIEKNPFVSIKKMKTSEKERRSLHPHEISAILEESQRQNPYFTLALMLIHYCFIRPKELRDLKIKHINIQSNLITIPGHTSKNRKSQSVTIPDDLLIFMEKFRIEKKDQEYYIIGKGLMPGTEQCGTNSLNNFHRKILEKLKIEKKIKNIQGISIYSWKDTGALELVSKGIDILQLKDQMRHSSLETTNCYIRSLGNVNEKIKSISGTMPLTILSLQSDLLNDTPSGS